MNKFNINPIQSRETAEDGERKYYIRGYEQPFYSVTTIIDVATPKSLKSWMKNNSAAKQDRVLKETADIGSRIHEAIELDLQNLVPEITDDIKQPFENWIKLKHECKIEPILTESHVYSPEFGYAGTIDILGTFKGKPCVMDIKTGFVSKKAGWQMAAYLYACIELNIVDPKDCGMVAISIHRDGSVGVPFVYEHIDWCLKSFCAAFEIFKDFNFKQMNDSNWSYLKNNSFKMLENYKEMVR